MPKIARMRVNEDALLKSKVVLFNVRANYLNILSTNKTTFLNGKYNLNNMELIFLYKPDSLT